MIKISQVGWIKSIGKIVNASLCLTEDSTIILYTVDEKGVPLEKIFSSPVTETKVSGSQQYLMLKVSDKKYQLDFSFSGDLPPLLTLDTVYRIAKTQEWIQASDVPIWLEELKVKGAQMNYLNLTKIITISSIASALVIAGVIAITSVLYR